MPYGAPQSSYSTSQAPSRSFSRQASRICSEAGSVYTSYSAPSPLGQTVGKVLQVIVHPPVTVTAEEFAQTNGTIISTPLAVTTIKEESALETGVVGTTERAVEKVVKKKRKKKK